MKIGIAGATGYLGSHIVTYLNQNNFTFSAIARNKQKLQAQGVPEENILAVDLSSPEKLKGALEGIDILISTVGITRQKDGLTYMDVDYQVNRNLLDEAIRAKVKRFIYVSVLDGDNLRHLAICAAKERFVDELKLSGMDYCIIRPSGFFSDLEEFLRMAKKGRVYLLGDGQVKVNPIHGADLAAFCVKAIEQNKKELNVGGPEVLTHQEIAKQAFDAVQKKPRITYIPDWVRRLLLRILPLVMRKSSFGPVQFFLNVMTMDMVGENYGKNKLGDHFHESLKK